MSQNMAMLLSALSTLIKIDYLRWSTFSSDEKIERISDFWSEAQHLQILKNKSKINAANKEYSDWLGETNSFALSFPSFLE